jgi:hypothetical protein
MLSLARPVSWHQTDVFKLVIPPRNLRGMFWSPESYDSPLSLSRVNPTSGDDVLETTAPPADVDGDIPSVTLFKRIGFTGLGYRPLDEREEYSERINENPYDVYYARVNSD